MWGAGNVQSKQWYLNPDGIGGMAPTLAFNTAASFTTNTNLQHYSGETGLSYFSQMVAITFMQFVTAATGMAPGFTGYFNAGRPEPSMIPRLFSTLVPKRGIEIAIVVGERRQLVPIADAVSSNGSEESTAPTSTSDVAHEPATADTQRVPLRRLALARSGDKGDHANIGVIARKPEYLPAIRAALTETAVM